MAKAQALTAGRRARAATVGCHTVTITATSSNGRAARTPLRPRRR